ncbi:exo-beta-N-acetylmuramidase NamZ family protein [Pseudalkalibacillus sp. Hm43]|uniref:exo-beta-N-acetylmuramidase NamZ family protein n=1 Tax=Pseudalkalibacillus sp. Hm43 TaxID=3450742 RepID=UPI003F42C361
MVQTGLHAFLNGLGEKYRGKKIGMILNHTSVTPSMDLSIDVLIEQGYDIVALFSPEHGLRGHVKEGQHISHETDPRTGLPVYSLYGKNKVPPDDWLKDIDVLLFDIQDLGVRFYTYIYTLANCMQVAGRLGKEFVVLDRPNPITGTRVEGNPLDLNFASFIGNYNLPIRHGMTVGELAAYINEEFGFNADLKVIKMEDWKREMWFDETSFQWTPPSPNAPSLDMAIVYPGTCFFEGTNVSEGRGTTKPFEWIGAPWINSFEWKKRLSTYSLEGVQFRETVFQPTTSKYEGETCFGLQVHVTDRETFQPVKTACAMMESLIQLHPEEFSWIQLKDGRYMVDLILGTDGFRFALEQQSPLIQWLEREEEQLETFKVKREKYLLYGGESL